MEVRLTSDKNNARRKHLRKTKAQMLEELEQLERRRAEDQRAAAAGRVGVWEWYLQTHEVYFSPNLEAMLGCADGQHIRRIDEWLARIDPADGDNILHEAEKYRTGELSGESVTEYRVPLGDGSVRWFEARARPIRVENDGAVILVGADTDISERKIAEETLRDSEQRFRDMAEATSD